MFVPIGIDVTLKTTVLKGNFRELSDMDALARKLNAKFNPSLSIVQKINHDTSPLAHALTLDEMMEIDIRAANNGLLPGEDHRDGAVLTCNAGCTSISIGPEGDVYPCVLLRERLGNIRERPLREIIFENDSAVLKRLREMKDSDIEKCFSCSMRKYCRRCPGTAYMGTGTVDGVYEFDCELAKKIREASMKQSDGQGPVINP